MAKALAPYQSPTFRAVVVAPAPVQQSERVTRFTLSIFDRDLHQESTINRRDPPVPLNAAE
jgi:hypothetical protein